MNSHIDLAMFSTQDFSIPSMSTLPPEFSFDDPKQSLSFDQFDLFSNTIQANMPPALHTSLHTLPVGLPSTIHSLPMPTMMPTVIPPLSNQLNHLNHLNQSSFPDCSPTSPDSHSTSPSSPASPHHSTDDSPSHYQDDSEESNSNLNPEVIHQLLAEQDLKKKRLARKAELARMSRKRKKTRMGDLEAEVSRLNAELERYKKQRKIEEIAQTHHQSSINAQQGQGPLPLTGNGPVMVAPSIATNAVSIPLSLALLDEDENKNMAYAMNLMVEKSRVHIDHPDINKHAEDLVQAFNRQNAASEKHLTALEGNTQPMMPLQFLSWVMSQNDKFIQDPSGLWSSLFCHEIGITADQMKELMALRTTVKKQRKVGPDVEKAFKKLNNALRRQINQTGENFTRLRSILSPGQLARYCDWVSRYGSVCLKINNAV